MTTFPIENNSNNDAVYSPTLPPVGRSGFKTLTNARLVLEDGEVKNPNPLIVHSLASGPSGKITIFMRRTSGITDGIVNIYGAFKPDATNQERVLLADGVAWTDTISEVVSEISNPFFILIIEYNFAGNENTTVELNISSF